jgi:serine/threonine protein kinase
MIDESFNVKLGSFGIARSVLSMPYPRTPVTRYTAPEHLYLSDLKPSDLKASDIWSIGIVFAELLKGSPLFDNKTHLLYQVRPL